MYSNLLILHSYFRWIVLIALLAVTLWIFIHHRKKTNFQKKHFQYLILFTFIINIQFILGWSLYLNSPLVKGFLNDIPLGIKNRQLRFFGLEHMSMMTLAAVLINLFTFKVRKHIGSQGFTYLWKRYIWILLIILSSIPWSFSPLTNRPNWR